MMIDTTHTIRSKVGGKTVVVPDDTIANYLHYPQPNLAKIQFPEGEYNPLTKKAYAQAIYMNQTDFIVWGKFMYGKFKPEYKLIRKIIH